MNKVQKKKKKGGTTYALTGTGINTQNLKNTTVLNWIALLNETICNLETIT